MVAALAFTADGTKLPVGRRDGSTENKTVVRGCCPDLVDRGLKFDDGLLVVLDGAKALAAAGREVSGAKALIQRCTLQHRRPATRRNRASPNPTMLLPAVGLPQSAPSVNFPLCTVGRGPPYLGMFAGLAVDPPEGHSSESNHRRNVPVYWPGGATQYGLKAQAARGGARSLAPLPID